MKEKKKTKRSKYTPGNEFTTKKGERIIIYAIVGTDKNRRTLYRVGNLTTQKLYPSVTSQQIQEMINAEDHSRIERNMTIQCMGGFYTFNQIDEMLDLKSGSSLRYFKRNGRDANKLIEKIRNYKFYKSFSK